MIIFKKFILLSAFRLIILITVAGGIIFLNYDLATSIKIGVEDYLFMMFDF